MTEPTLVALDLEGVLLNEVWLSVADSTGIGDLRLTTRDVADYDQLMQMRLRILHANGLTLSHLQAIIRDSVTPIAGAMPFLAWLRQRTPVVILSDIFLEFVAPVMDQLQYPTIFGNTLTVDAETNMITDYHIRQHDGKRKAIEAMHHLGFRTFAAGDSYNDLTMIQTAHAGALFRAPGHIVAEHPHIRSCTEFGELQSLIQQDLLALDGCS